MSRCAFRDWQEPRRALIEVVNLSPLPCRPNRHEFLPAGQTIICQFVVGVQRSLLEMRPSLSSLNSLAGDSLRFPGRPPQHVRRLPSESAALECPSSISCLVVSVLEQRLRLGDRLNLKPLTDGPNESTTLANERDRAEDDVQQDRGEGNACPLPFCCHAHRNVVCGESERRLFASLSSDGARRARTADLLGAMSGRPFAGVRLCSLNAHG
jgi:hypothetical protein